MINDLDQKIKLIKIETTKLHKGLDADILNLNETIDNIGVILQQNKTNYSEQSKKQTDEINALKKINETLNLDLKNTTNLKEKLHDILSKLKDKYNKSSAIKENQIKKLNDELNKVTNEKLKLTNIYKSRIKNLQDNLVDVKTTNEITEESNNDFNNIIIKQKTDINTLELREKVLTETIKKLKQSQYNFLEQNKKKLDNYKTQITQTNNKITKLIKLYESYQTGGKKIHKDAKYYRKYLKYKTKYLSAKHK